MSDAVRVFVTKYPYRHMPDQFWREVKICGHPTEVPAEEWQKLADDISRQPSSVIIRVYTRMPRDSHSKPFGYVRNTIKAIVLRELRNRIPQIYRLSVDGAAVGGEAGEVGFIVNWKR